MKTEILKQNIEKNQMFLKIKYPYFSFAWLVIDTYRA